MATRAASSMVTGSFTPSENTAHFEVTGLSGPPKVVLCMIRDPETNASDGTIKSLGFVYAYGVTAFWHTNNAGKWKSVNSGTAAEDWFVEPTPVEDGTVVTEQYVVIPTRTGFSVKGMNNSNYVFKTPYIYDWVAYV